MFWESLTSEKKKKKKEQSLRGLWDIIKHSNIHVMWVLEKDNFLNGKNWRNTGLKLSKLSKKCNLQMWESQKIPSRIKAKRATPRYIMAKRLKFKDKAIILGEKKREREKERKATHYIKVRLKKRNNWILTKNNGCQQWDNIFGVLNQTTTNEQTNPVKQKIYIFEINQNF